MGRMVGLSCRDGVAQTAHARPNASSAEIRLSRESLRQGLRRMLIDRPGNQANIVHVRIDSKIHCPGIEVSRKDLCKSEFVFPNDKKNPIVTA